MTTQMLSQVNHKIKLCHFADPWSFSLFANQTKSPQNKVYDTSTIFAVGIFSKEIFQMRRS